MANCNMPGCKENAKRRGFLPGNYVLCDVHCIDLFKLFSEECKEYISSDSVASAIVQISIKMESNPIPSILSSLDEDDDGDLSLGNRVKDLVIFKKS